MMNIQKEVISVSFSKIRSFEDVTVENENANVLDAQECFFLCSAKGHKSQWNDVYVNFSAIRTLKGFKEGLKSLYAKNCSRLVYPVFLPSSCKNASFDETSIKALRRPISGIANAFDNMTDGIENLSLYGCKRLKSLRGIAPSVKVLRIDETSVRYLANLHEGIIKISARDCPDLKYVKSVPSTCQELDLSFSRVRRIKNIPSTIKKINLYCCADFEMECLKDLEPSILPRINGLSSPAQEYANQLYADWAKENNIILIKSKQPKMLENSVIQIKEGDIVYSVDKDVTSLKELFIPQQTTVLNASECKKLYDLSGIENLENLRAVLLNGTDIGSKELDKIPQTIEELDIRSCSNIRSYSLLGRFQDAHAILSFNSERILRTIPDNVDCQIIGLPYQKTVSKHKALFESFNEQNVRG